MRIHICRTLIIDKSAVLPSGGIHADHFEILYITKGTAKFQWAGHSCEVEAPAIFLILPSTPHLLESVSAEISCCFIELVEVNDHYFNAYNMDLWNAMQSQEINTSKALFTSTIQQSLDFINHLYLMGEAKRHEELEQVCLLEVEKIFKLMTHILLPASNQNVSTSQKKKWSAGEAVEILIAYMEWRFKEEITLKLLSDLVHLNPSYLIRIFKEHTQHTPFEYLQILRMKAAVSYLTRSDLPLRTIVEMTGFNSIHYFCRLFKKMHGDSPVHWRNQLKETEALISNR